MNTETAAFSCCGFRIAPVFDVSDTLLISGHLPGETSRKLYVNPDWSLPQLCGFMKSHGINTLICGAVSREYEEYLEAEGITVIPFLAGDINEIRQAYEQGKNLRELFFMPGCRCLGKRRNHFAVRRRNQYARFRRKRT